MDAPTPVNQPGPDRTERLVQKWHERASFRVFSLAFLFMIALLIRLYQIGSPFFHFAVESEYEAARTARLFYYRVTPGVPVAQREVAEFNYQHAPPEVGGNNPFYRPFQLLVVSGYRLVGGEKPWVPKLLTTFLWLIGGVFFYGIARGLLPDNAAIVSLIIYLFHPFGVLGSRSFVVDPVMVTFMLASLLVIWRYFELPSIPRLLGATTLSTLSILFLPKCFFMLVAAFLVPSLSIRGFKGTFVSANTWIFVSISAGLPILYYFLLHTTASRQHTDQLFVWQLYRSAHFWLGWLGSHWVYGSGLPVLGVLMIAERRARAFLLALWLGYFVYGLTFTYRIFTHPYVTLPLLPVEALSLGALYSAGLKALRDWRKSRAALRSRQWYPVLAQTSAVAVFCLFLFGSWWAIRDEDTGPRSLALAREATRASAVGKALNYSTRVVYLAHFEGQVLMYHGEIGAIGWPSLGAMRAQRLIGHPMVGEKDAALLWQTTFQGKDIQYFVVTNLIEYADQPSLRAFLQRYPSCQGADFLIFDLRDAPAAPLRCGGAG